MSEVSDNCIIEARDLINEITMMTGGTIDKLSETYAQEILGRPRENPETMLADTSFNLLKVSFLVQATQMAAFNMMNGIIAFVSSTPDPSESRSPWSALQDE